jgi:hypothetical protein
MKLNASQQEVLEKTIENLELGRSVKVTGAAGSGKTVLIKELAKQYPGAFLTAATNSAAVNIDGVTVCKLIKGVPVYTEEGELKFHYDYPDTDGLKYLVVDEAWMLGAKEVAWAQEIPLPIVWVGDRNQLPPVKEKVSVLEAEKISLLTIEGVERYGGELLENSLRVLRAESPTDIVRVFNRLPEADYSSIVEGGENIVLAYTNRDVALNWQGIHLNWGRQDSYWKGLRVLAQVTRPKVGMFASEAYPIDLIDKLGNVLVCHTQFKKLDEKAEEKLADMLEKAQQTRTNRGWQKYYEEHGKYFQLLPYYSRTVHRAQGRTFDNVVLDTRSILSCRDFSTMKKLAYTAMTRAKNNVYALGS